MLPMNMQSTSLRPTVAGIPYARSHLGDILILVHWPDKARKADEASYTTVGGRWERGELQIDAMAREFSSEYRVGRESITILPIKHSQHVAHGKEYFWHLINVIPGPSAISRGVGVAGFGWLNCRASLEAAIALMHSEKQEFFRQALLSAVALEPALSVFRK